MCKFGRSLLMLSCILFLLEYNSGSAKDLYTFIIKRMTCGDFDPRIAFNGSCSTSLVSRTIKSHSLIMYTHPNVTLNEIFVKISYIRKVGNVFSLPLISMEENHCGFLAGTSKSYLIKILWPFLQKTSNLPSKCPYQGVFNVSEFIFHDSFLPPALPEGEARLDIHVRNGRKRISMDLYNFLVNRMTCENCDPILVFNCTCTTQAISRTQKSHTILIYVQPGVKLDSLFVKVNYFQKVGNLYRRSVIDMEENFCGYRAGTSKSYLISILWPFIKKQSNLPEKCPLENLINITGLIFYDSLLPPALPEGQARLDIHIRNGPKRASLMKVKFYIEIKPKGASRLDFK